MGVGRLFREGLRGLSREVGFATSLCWFFVTSFSARLCLIAS